MKMKKTLCRVLCAVCALAMVLPVIFSVTASAASTKYIQSYYYPTKTLIGEELPYNQLSDQNGNPAQIEIGENQYTLITYWASWCPDCKEELSHLPELLPVLDEYENVQWYLVNRTDGVDDTIATASAYLKEQGITLPSLYDEGLAFRNALGINSIPTTILLNPEGEVELINPNVITTPGQLRAMLDYAINGADSATLSYVQANLLNESGSVKRAAGSTTTSSAAQGLLAQYAVDSLNKSLLDTQRQWVVANGSTGGLGDDLALLGALSSWRGYEGDAATLGETIVNTYFADGQLNGQVALSDLDLESMMLLGRGAPYDEALSAIQKGFIGAQFPLYYSEYNADKGTYNHQVIDTADALTTVYHLAQVGKVRKQTINWLYDQVEGDGLRARYTTDGEVVATYNYETPALYALTALIALEVGEEDLFTQSVMLMETCRTFDTASASNGSFTTRNKDSAFDQCAALLVYAKMQQE